jgi:hypothetical protein
MKTAKNVGEIRNIITKSGLEGVTVLKNVQVKVVKEKPSLTNLT